MVRVKTFDESKTLYSQITTNNSLIVDLSTLEPTTDAPYCIEVSANGSSSKVVQSKKPFYLLDNASSVAITQNLDKIKSKVDTESAIGNLIIASFYEENGFTMYAIKKKKKAVQLEPNVSEYKEVRNIYFNNHQVLFSE